VLRALSLCTCCRHYPGAATGCIPRSSHPAVSAFPDSTIVSACTSSFSRFARRSLALRPAHSRGHQFVTSYPKASDISSPPCLLRLLPAGANRRVGLAPTGKRRLVTAHVVSRPCRHSWQFGGGALRLIGRHALIQGLGHAAADVDADRTEQQAEEERQPPAPRQELPISENSGQHDPEDRPDQRDQSLARPTANWRERPLRVSEWSTR